MSNIKGNYGRLIAYLLKYLFECLMDKKKSAVDNSKYFLFFPRKQILTLGDDLLKI